MIWSDGALRSSRATRSRAARARRAPRLPADQRRWRLAGPLISFYRRCWSPRKKTATTHPPIAARQRLTLMRGQVQERRLAAKRRTSDASGLRPAARSAAAGGCCAGWPELGLSGFAIVRGAETWKDTWFRRSPAHFAPWSGGAITMGARRSTFVRPPAWSIDVVTGRAGRDRHGDGVFQREWDIARLVERYVEPPHAGGRRGQCGGRFRSRRQQ
jgi:hypothetical protein